MKRCGILIIIICIFIASCTGCRRADLPSGEDSQKPIENTQNEQFVDNDEGDAGVEVPPDTDTAIENGDSAQGQEEVIVKEPSRMEILLEISAGVESGEIGYEDNLMRMMGPESFMVKGKDIYILDTINNRILIYEGADPVGSVSVEESYRAQNFIVHKNSFFVLDMSDTICEYNPEGVVVNEYDLPKGKYYYDVDNMRVTDERKVVIDFADGTAYLLENGDWILHNEEAVFVKSNEENAQIEYKGLTWTIPRKIVKEGISYLGIDNENNCYVLRMTSGSGSVISFTYRIEKYSLDGKLVAWADIDTTDWIVFFGRCIHVTSEGEIYIMACLEDKVVGMQVFLGNMD